MEHKPEDFKGKKIDSITFEELPNIGDETIAETLSGLTGNLQSGIFAKSNQVDLLGKYVNNEVCSIVTRIKYLQDGIKRNAAKAEQLKELIGLFEKYPDILRMLDRADAFSGTLTIALWIKQLISNHCSEFLSKWTSTSLRCKRDVKDLRMSSTF